MRALRPGLRSVAFLSVVAAALFAGASHGLLGACGPFTDVAADAFCPFVLEIFYAGITSGTTATTYDPTSSVTRLQMAAFLSRSVDGVLKRGSRRAALDQFWTPGDSGVLGITTVGSGPEMIRSDGLDIWVPASSDNTVSRVRGSDGSVLGTWTGAVLAFDAVVAMGRVLVAGNTSPGRLYEINPTQPAGSVTTVASNLGNSPLGMTFDGTRFWVATQSGAISLVTPGATIPWTVTAVNGFTLPESVLYDGSNVWLTDLIAGSLLKLDSSGAVLQTVTVGSGPGFPVFDGSNIWVPNQGSQTVTVVRASSGSVLATLTGNGLFGPFVAAFDGQRVLVTDNSGSAVSLWKSADLTPMGSLALGASPRGACSDGVNFWIAMGANLLARF
jgi:hypothetical protein